MHKTMPDQPMKPIVIGIAGGSGAGKVCAKPFFSIHANDFTVSFLPFNVHQPQTTFARALYDKLGQSDNIAYLTHDYYYKDITHMTMEERARTNFDHPSALDTDLLIEHIQQLKRGLHVDVPHYDFATHARTSEVTRMAPKKIILIEGILILAEPKLVDELDIKVYCVRQNTLMYIDIYVFCNILTFDFFFIHIYSTSFNVTLRMQMQIYGSCVDCHETL